MLHKPIYVNTYLQTHKTGYLRGMKFQGDFHFLLVDTWVFMLFKMSMCFFYNYILFLKLESSEQCVQCATICFKKRQNFQFVFACICIKYLRKYPQEPGNRGFQWERNWELGRRFFTFFLNHGNESAFQKSKLRRKKKGEEIRKQDIWEGKQARD